MSEVSLLSNLFTLHNTVFLLRPQWSTTFIDPSLIICYMQCWLIALPPTGLILRTVGWGDSIPGCVGVARGLPVDGGTSSSGAALHCETLALRDYGLGYVEVHPGIHLCSSSMFKGGIGKWLHHSATVCIQTNMDRWIDPDPWQGSKWWRFSPLLS